MTIRKVDFPSHQPVLIRSLIEKLPFVAGVWIDCTFGAGGYTRALLDAGAQKVIGIDRDPSTLAHAATLKAKYGSKFELCEANFSMLELVATQFKLKQISGIVFDVGVSSMQIDEAGRGFSFQRDGPLDMRMSQNGVTAADIVNNVSEADLADIIYYYGEDRAARVIAKAIIQERTTQEINSTEHLSNLINGAIGRSNYKSNKSVNPSTRTFQALRIAVNNELEELYLALIAAEKILDEGAILAVVSFHSLEDRIIKKFIKSRSINGSGQSRYLPQLKSNSPTFRELFNKVLRPTDEEILANPRARSAKLRIATRLRPTGGRGNSVKIEFPKVNYKLGIRQ